MSAKVCRGYLVPSETLTLRAPRVRRCASCLRTQEPTNRPPSEGRLERITVRFTPELAKAVASWCESNSIPAARLVRDALQLYFDVKAGKAFDPQRMAIICEYTQLVADEWVKKNAPDRRDEFLATVDARLDRHHGG